ncbi:unnamed protein product, partial [Closterium sp. NIES-54]
MCLCVCVCVCVLVCVCSCACLCACVCLCSSSLGVPDVSRPPGPCSTCSSPGHSPACSPLFPASPA